MDGITAAEKSNSVLGPLREKFEGRRGRAVLICAGCLIMFAVLFITGFMMDDSGLRTNFLERSLAPSLEHPFGTDWLGRDMLVRTVKGLCLSLQVGMLAAACSTVFALLFGLCAATLGPKADSLVTGLIDVIMSTPHLVMLILISFTLGGGAAGVISAVALTHWTRLARIVRAEMLQLRNAEFIKISEKMGKGRLWIARHHMLPHVFPQFMIGLILLFPHAIMHAAGLTFLGFGLSPHNPSIGILLSEAMQHLSTGYWWLAVAPGLCLVLMVKAFDILGNTMRYLMDPKTSQQ